MKTKGKPGGPPGGQFLPLKGDILIRSLMGNRGMKVYKQGERPFLIKGDGGKWGGLKRVGVHSDRSPKRDNIPHR